MFGDEVGTEPAPADGDEFTANFLRSMFYGGAANFQRAVFNGHANFAEAQLKSNSTEFDQTKFNGHADFVGAQLKSRSTGFGQTKFNGRLTFSVSFAAVWSCSTPPRVTAWFVA